MAASDLLSRGHIGPYRIVARVGAGGMGEVFKAWDPRLERDVAIKLLHPDSTGNPDRQRRLLAEGRAASALCHPNILRVYDADVDGTSYYLVTEWLEGKSLRDEMSRGSLPLKRLLDLSVQIADGLAAAHAIGIVHRDIKPENVMLARDGTARIVDFGLARSDPHAPSMSTVGQAATVSLEGGLSGTPAYMSPEQARGSAGDFRTDQFSFGALVYELATGKFAFRRDTVADTLSAVLHEEPRPLSDLNPRIPAPFRWAIERCLAKDPSERYSATDDLAREVRWIRDHLSEALAEPKPLEGTRAGVPGWQLLTGLALAAVVGAAATLGLGALTPANPPLNFSPFASASAYEGEPAWSPDGQTIAYTADVDGVLQVFVKRVGDALSRQVTQGNFDSSHPFWAPNGQRLYFVSPAGEHDGLWSVGVAGGRPELLLENVARAAIDPEGKRMALLRDEPEAILRLGLWWSSPPGAEPTRETRPPFDQLRTGGNGQMRFSRDGRLLFWVYAVDAINPNNPQQSSDFYIIPNGPGAPRKVLSSVASTINLTPFDWMPDNRHVIVSLPEPRGDNRHLWMADIESGSLKQITVGHTNETVPAVAANGLIAYASDEVDFDLVQIASDGQSRRTMLATARNELDPAWSPAGDQYAFVTDRSGSIEIWARSRDGKFERPIVTSADFGNSRTQTLASLAFSPNGSTLAYQRGGDGTFEIWLSPATGGTPIRIISSEEPGGRPWRDAPTWSPDGESIAYIRNFHGRVSLAKTRIGSGETVELSEGPAVFSRPAWSPDGKWIACQLTDRLVRVPAEGGMPVTITEVPTLAFAWRPDSRRLVVLTESETSGHFAFGEVSVDSGDLRLLNPDLGPIPIANEPIRGFSYLGSQGFLTSLASARSDIWLLEGFTPPRGWLSTLFRRRPQP
jgi:Tol biopolymer transport system component